MLPCDQRLCHQSKGPWWPLMVCLRCKDIEAIPVRANLRWMAHNEPERAVQAHGTL